MPFRKVDNFLIVLVGILLVATTAYETTSQSSSTQSDSSSTVQSNQMLPTASPIGTSSPEPEPDIEIDSDNGDPSSREAARRSIEIVKARKDAQNIVAANPNLSWSVESDFITSKKYYGDEFKDKGGYCPDEYLVFYGADKTPELESGDSNIMRWRVSESAHVVRAPQSMADIKTSFESFTASPANERDEPIVCLDGKGEAHP